MAGRHVQNESAILSKIDDMDELDGTEYEGGDEQSTETNDDEGNADNENPGSTDELNDAGKPAEVDAEGEAGKTEAKAEEPSGDKESGLRKQGENHVDKHNNIVDPRTGAIIAKAGTERRLYEKTQRQSKILEPLQAKLAEYEKKENDINGFFGAVKQAGLSTEEVGEAFDIAIQFKKAPLEAAKKVVEQVLALGHNVTDILGAEAGNAIEMSAVQRMLDNRLAPITAPLQKQREEDQRRRDAEVELAKWVEKTPYADVQLETIDEILGHNPKLSVDEAYNGLMVTANKYKLDIEQPLGPQIKALIASAQNKSPEPTNRPTPRTQRPFPNGSRNVAQPIDEKDIAEPSTSWNDIIKRSMA